MKITFFIPAAMAVMLASGTSFANSSVPPAMTPGHPEATAAERASNPDHVKQTAVRHASCTALEARFDRDLARPSTRTPHDIAEATTLRREGATLCEQTKEREGAVYLRSAIAVLVGHHRA